MSGRKLAGTMVLILVSAGGCSHTRPFFPRPAFQPLGATPDGDNLDARVILAGDAGESDPPTLGLIGEWARRAPDTTRVVFLGDNMYPEGMTARREGEASRKLLPLIDTATGSGARPLFIPGNHDWADGGPGGLAAVRAQADFVRARAERDDAFPFDGCPGPVTIEASPTLRIVAIDSQWWLHPWEKPVEECAFADPDAFRNELASVVDTDQDVVIVAHHPLDGHGRHAGFTSLREHLIPPIAGSVVALRRRLAPRAQDYGSEPYRAMTDLFRSALEDPPRGERLRIWASGHEHSLEIQESDVVDYVLVSGSAAKTTPIGDGPTTLFALSRPGFMVLDFESSGRVLARVIEPDRIHTFLLRESGL